MAEKQKIQLTIPANLNYSALIRHIADEVFAIAKFSKPWCSRLKLIVDELFMNAVRYGSAENKSFIYTTFLYDEDGIQFTIEDDGTGPQSLSAEDLKAIIQKNEKNTDVTRTSGRGLSMITKLWTDQMEITKSKYGGVAISFIKRLETAVSPPKPLPPPSGLIKKAIDASAPQSAKAEPAPKPEAVPAKTPPKAEPPSTKPAEVPVPAAAPSGTHPVYEIKLSGEIDQSNITEKVAPIYDQIEVMPENGVLMLDFSELEYINSTFIGNLAAWYTSLQRKGGRICLKNVNDEIKEVLSLVGLLNILECPVS